MRATLCLVTGCEEGKHNMILRARWVPTPFLLGSVTTPDAPFSCSNSLQRCIAEGKDEENAGRVDPVRVSYRAPRHLWRKAK